MSGLRRLAKVYANVRVEIEGRLSSAQWSYQPAYTCLRLQCPRVPAGHAPPNLLVHADSGAFSCLLLCTTSDMDTIGPWGDGVNEVRGCRFEKEKGGCTFADFAFLLLQFSSHFPPLGVLIFGPCRDLNPLSPSPALCMQQCNFLR